MPQQRRYGGGRDGNEPQTYDVPRARLFPMFDPSSRGRLTERDLDRFPTETLFDRIARTVCAAGCLPRKELYEAWEVARRVRRLFRGGRVVDLGAGHGLLAQILLLLDDSSPSAVVIDKAVPASSAKVHAALVQVWPRLAGRVTFLEVGSRALTSPRPTSWSRATRAAT